MTIQTQKNIIKSENKQTKKKYIPGLAAFYFKPTHPWDEKDAIRMYEEKYSDQYNKVFYKDCINGMRQLPTESIDLIVADPPFGLDFTGKESIYNRKKDFVLEDYHEINQSEYYNFSKSWISKLPRIMKKTASAAIISGWTNLADVLVAIRESNLVVINHIIWHYQFGVFTQNKLVTSHYHILWVVKDPKSYFFNKIDHYPLDVWKIKRKYKREEKKNGTKLPVELILKIIDFLSKPGDLILDPFMGNGTTAVGAKGNYRYFVGFEINKRMEPIVNLGLSKIKLGGLFTPYSEMEPDIDKLKKKYPKAYKVYKSRKVNNNDG